MYKKEIESILKEMTLKEKIGQLQQVTGDFFLEEEGLITGPMQEFGISEEEISMVGSVLGLSGADKIYEVQKTYLENSRLKIPLLFMADIIHGYETIFPIPLGLSCSWDEELIKKVAQISAREGAVSGLHVTFSPMIDLVRDPRWGRVMESFGEDTLLTTRLGQAMIEGYQGDFGKDTLAACAKHFIGYGAGEAGRDYNTVDMSRLRLLEDYMPPFVEAIKKDVKMIMTSFNTFEGIPTSGHKELTNEYLRNELGFDGVIISDWNSIQEMVHHRVAADRKEASRLGIEASVDIDMMSFSYYKNLEELVNEGLIEIDLINQSVYRILQLKFELGLFDNPYRYMDREEEKKVVLSDIHREKAREIAEDSVVLLKNNNVLPLSKNSNVLFVGPFVNSRDLLGEWSWHGSKEEVKTIKEVLNSKAHVDFIELDFNNYELLDEHTDKFSWADEVVLLLGESNQMSGEAASRTNIKLPYEQERIIHKVRKNINDKNLSVVLIAGRPLELTAVIDKVDAVLMAWYPGTEGARAIVNTLYGDNNPAGKLTMTFPRNIGQIPIYYNYYQTGRPHDIKGADPKYTSKYLDVDNTPLYPFGHGLSYSTFEYSDLILESDEIDLNGTLKASVNVENISEKDGYEIVQWYNQDMVGEVIRPENSLIDFEKVFIKAKEKIKVHLDLDIKELHYRHNDLTTSIEPGDMKLRAGSSSENYLEREYILR